MEKNLTYNLKQKLQKGDVIFGQMIGPRNDPKEIVGALRDFGYDFIIIDIEHSLVDKGTIFEYISISREFRLPIFIRAEEATANFRSYLDSGINGLLLPRLKTIEQAVYALNQAYLPPMGQRGSGIGMSPYLLDGQDLANMPLMEMTTYVNNNTMVFPMTETIECFRTLHRILSLDGISGTIVGINDFVLDIGNIPIKALRSELVESDLIEEKLKQVVKMCRDAGKVAGIGGLAPNGLAKWVKEGYQILLVGYVINGNIDGSRNSITELKSLL